jgi:hypothetical protein
MAGSTDRTRDRRRRRRRPAERHHDPAAEIRQDLEAANAYMAEHGSFAELVRRYYRDRAED